MSQNKSGLNLVFYLICLGIIYGSLFPFQFSPGLDKELLSQFLLSWRTAPGIGDILGNSALFIPYGLVAFVLFNQPGKYHNRAAFFVVTWLLLAAGSQITQLFLPSRDPSIFDLYGNAFGAILGWTFGRFMPGTLNPGMVNINAERQIPLILVAFWLASELIPFVPTIDFQAYKNALKPLLLAPQWSWQECLIRANCWVACFYLVHHGGGFFLRTGHLLSGALGILALKVVIVENNVSLTDVVAVACALVIWSWLKGRRLRSDLLGYSLLASFSLYMLSPFVFRAEPATFGWVPFTSYLQGSMLINATVLCRKLFVFGAMAILILRDRPHKKKLSLLIAALLMILEILQLWVGYGTPELTDPLLFLIVAWLFFSVWSNGASPGLGAYLAGKKTLANVPVSSASTVEAVTPEIHIRRRYRPEDNRADKPAATHICGANNSRPRVAIVVGIYCLLAMVSLKILLGIPGVPYNVVELFRFGGSGVDLLFFSMTLLSLGWGSAWLGRVVISSHKPAVEIPCSLIKLTTVIYLLLWLSVTRESIMDIAGSSVFVHRVTERGVLGVTGAQIVEVLGPANVRVFSDIIEPVIRFGALTGPLLIFYSLGLGITLRSRWQISNTADTVNHVWIAGCCLVLYLYLCKVVAFDWSSTDNVNEIIARDGPWGVGGGGYLYLLVLFLCSLSAAATGCWFSNFRKPILATIVLLASLPIGWLLLNHGLEQNIVKYGLHFSGVDFLLGPDRRGLISGPELFFRWSVVQIVFVVGMAFGAILYVYWAGQGVPVESKESIAREKAVTP